MSGLPMRELAGEGLGGVPAHSISDRSGECQARKGKATYAAFGWPREPAGHSSATAVGSGSLGHDTARCRSRPSAGQSDRGRAGGQGAAAEAGAASAPGGSAEGAQQEATGDHALGSGDAAGEATSRQVRARCAMSTSVKLSGLPSRATRWPAKNRLPDRRETKGTGCACSHTAI